MEICLDGEKMLSRSALHDYLTRMLSLPAYYGRNLDALYDLLTDRSEPAVIVLLHREAMMQHLGSYGEILEETFIQASDDNPLLSFTIR